MKLFSGPARWLRRPAAAGRPDARAGRRGRGSRKPVVERLEGRRLLSGDMVLQWNSVALQAVAADHSGGVSSQGGPTRTARALAIVHAAIADSVADITRSFSPYLVRMRAPRGASVEAAVAQAGHDTLAALYPYQKLTFDAARRASLAQVPDGRGEQTGIG